MSLIYRLLGLAARIHERVARTRVNFIPLSWLMYFLLCVLAVVGAKDVRVVLVNGDQPRVVGIDEVLAHKDMQRNFVTVQGTLIPKAALVETRKERLVAAYLPLVSATDKRALLVKYPAHRVPAEKEAKEIAITGMLEGLDADVTRHLIQTGTGQEAGLDLDFMLVEGRAPGSLAVRVAVTLAATLSMVALLLVRIWRFVVFRRSDEVDAAAESPPPTAVDLRVSGLFRLGEHKPHRFLDVPAALTRLESGDLAMVANVDASSRLFGVKTTDRSGLWSIVVSFEQVTQVETGSLYLGLRRRPALRMKYSAGGSRKGGVAVLSCPDVAQRTFVRHELARLARGSQPSP